ncbi:hypothetical protein ARTHRO9AX_130070 [Arthrobacter sp. 9AX]|nr:hypothetical protein ARTHRO9AX_130070 [Arthrobacter sp. 9AX]
MVLMTVTAVRPERSALIQTLPLYLTGRA